MEQGYLVCIFAEGALTRTGQLRAFKPGLERIVKGTSFPVIPVHLGGIWGSRFSRFTTILRGDRAPLRWRYPVTVAFGEPLPPDSKAWQVQQAVRELSSIHMDLRRRPGRHVGLAFIRSARRNFRRFAMNDTTGKSVTHGKALIGAVVLSRLFAKRLAADKNVGVVVPPSVGGSLVNLGLVLAGKVPINLNFTASMEAFRSSLRQADIRTVITARKMMDKFPDLGWPDQVVFAEDFATQISALDKIIGLGLARFCPARWLVSGDAHNGDALLTIMFSSGTTGEPKGVMLSHHNILSNLDSIGEAFRPDGDVHLCAALPIFHSFGFTAGICLPLLCGLKVSYHTSPLDAGQVIEAIRKNGCNTLFSTPTFLSSYLRKAEPSDFSSLRFVLVGAEKLRKNLAEAFEDKFGVEPLEGYGTTEMAPVVALNLPDAYDEITPQVGNKAGSIGQPLPGIAAKIVDPETGAVLPPDQSGMLLVRGPNRMLGYLNRPDLTEAATRDGWYVTGDIATIDEDGFIFITDRLFRFSKIAGEMVPHMAAEDALTAGLNLVEMSLAVTSVPDEKKGERLALLYTEAIGDPGRMKQVLDDSGLPNLWRPSESMFFKVDKLPVTSTGKLDMRSIKQIALECASMLRP
jgi:acyl-[acyl-carrier-protein]-phospholipid O-acyltransferase/long-chain-fatty-acid--[acyl-carrier-protein] ligase